jgi:four helix bundle protein
MGSDEQELSFEEWQERAPKRLREDPLWASAYYRLAMYLYDLVWIDCERLRMDFRGREIVQQLVRSAGGICANLEEAYGRGVGTADYIRIVRIALGEARETQGWYFRSRHVLSPEILESRLQIIVQIITLLARTISSHREKLRSSSP